MGKRKKLYWPIRAGLTLLLLSLVKENYNHEVIAMALM